MPHQVNLPSREIEAFCRKHRIRRLAVFGSALRADFGPDSDVDMLVEFEPEAHVGYLGLVAMEMELGQIVGRRVDLRTRNELSRYFRDQVLEAAEPAYVRG